MRFCPSLKGIAGALAGLTLASTASANVCADAMSAAAARHGVPEEIILAIGTVESGFNPYAINSAGTPHFAEDLPSAVAFVRGQQALGISSIDVGCGQINLNWHPNAFASLQEAFTPSYNAEYAASLLATLYGTHNDWTRAVAHYHSGNQVHQERYLAAITRALGNNSGVLVGPSRLTLGGARLDMAPPVALGSAEDVNVVRIGLDASPRANGVRVFRAPSATADDAADDPRTVRVVRTP